MEHLITHQPVNPTLEDAQKALEEVSKGTTRIIGQGGGSTLDVAKWVANELKIPFTAIPTTAGTGSEVTKYCVLMVEGKKKTFNLKEPDSYVLDPRLVVSLPPLHTLASGLDALSQSFESLWSKNATKESKLYSKLAIKLILHNLPICLKDPTNEKARMDMLIGANFSGRAINITKTNICHAISYPLTEIYNIPHGIACAMSLVYFTNKALGIDLTNFIKKLNIPTYKIDYEKISEIVIKSEKLNDCRFLITKQDIIKALDGRRK